MKYWKDEYRTGIEEIDKQHMKLFDIAGRIHDLIENAVYSDKYDQIVELLEELKDYTVYHFGYEEDYMQKIGFKKYFTHKVEHDDFIEKMNGINLDEVDENHDKYLMDILEFVVKWINEHILLTDMQYVVK